MPLRPRFYARTDVGMVREHNEDNFLIDRSLGLYVVADGMGGHAAGEVASALAVRSLHDSLRHKKARLLEYAADPRGKSAPKEQDVLAMLGEAVAASCSLVFEQARIDSSRRGMGTTMCAVMILGEKAFIAHVGDSRIYRRRNREVTQITDDHTVQNELMKRGNFTQAQIDKIGHKNAITRAIGVYDSVEPDLFTLDLIAGDTFILASDGLTGYLDAPDDLLPAIDLPGDKSVDNLIAHANSSGGKDNITVIIVHLDDVRDASSANIDRELSPPERLVQAERKYDDASTVLWSLLRDVAASSGGKTPAF